MRKGLDPAEKKSAPPPDRSTDTPKSVSSNTSRPKFPIVGIGASAGGLAAIEAFLSAMPPLSEKNKAAFIIIQHLSPDHRSILHELLKRSTQMSVFEAEDGVEIEPSCVYIIPPNRDIGILENRLQLFETTSIRGARHPIDFFFRSLAADRHDQSICIILSGTGSDGALGMRAIKGEGGMAMAQTPATTEFDGMPRNAIATGLVDFVLPPGEMPAQLMAYISQMASKPFSAGFDGPQQPKDVLAKLTVLLRAKTGHDFSQYKESTVIRRVERRMALHQIESMAEYLRFMQQNTKEVSALFGDLLIGVTSFFRDSESFAALESVVIPRLVTSGASSGIIRVWVCGCSTGEEAYSIAILIQEQLERFQQTCKVQIFATDLDNQATDQARTGNFPASIAADVSPERLARYFIQDPGGSYRVEKVIRDQLIFSVQDVLKDPPFSRLDLISCRNLLIYLNADVQKRLMPLFHYALNPGAILFLGSAESIGDQQTLFDVLDRKSKLYIKKVESGVPVPRFGEFVAKEIEVARPVVPTAQTRRPQKLDFRSLTERALLNHLNAAAVLVNGKGEILYFHGRTGTYLEPAPGEATAANVLAMAREGLRHDLTAALHRVVTKRQPVTTDGVRVKANGHVVTVKLSIWPIDISKPDLFLVTLEERPQTDVPQAVPTDQMDGDVNARVTELEQKIKAKDDYLQTIVEEMETSGEELKSANEEMQSVNEEMQSANEELETSREELQSVNEELSTVNSELQQKVADLSRANNDMNNLLAGTGVGTLFVDHEMRITRFTPSIIQIINFIGSDVGRPLADIMSNIVGYDRLLADVQKVFDTLTPIEIEVETKTGAWYILTIRPYRTLENVIEGAVITFVDITKRKSAEQALTEANLFRQAAQIETVGIAFFNMDGAFTSANESFLNMVGYSRGQLETGGLNWEMITPDKERAQQRKAMDELRTVGHTAPGERDLLRKDGSLSRALVAKWRLTDAEAVVYLISVAHETFKPQPI